MSRSDDTRARANPNGPVIHTPPNTRTVFCRDCQEPVQGRIKVGRCVECTERNMETHRG